MSLSGCQITRLMSIFISKKSWKFVIQIQLTKSNPRITRGVKVPCLMPIRVKQPLYEYVRAYVIEEKFTSNNNFSLSWSSLIFLKSYHLIYLSLALLIWEITTQNLCPFRLNRYTEVDHTKEGYVVCNNWKSWIF